MTATVLDDRWQLAGVPVVILENRWLRLVVAPSLGAKLVSLEHRPAGREWLWRNPRIELAAAPFGAPFDDHWAGGADAFFPTCYPCEWQGVRVPDSGEWWSIPWRWQPLADRDGAGTGTGIALAAGGRVWPVMAERTVVLADDAPVVRLGFRIANVGSERVPYLLGFHPALAVAPGCRIHLPDGRVRVDEGDGKRLGRPGLTYRWPNLVLDSGERVDVGLVPDAGVASYGGHFLFPDDPQSVWWAVTDAASGVGLGLHASTPPFAGLWLWQVYGGWRGYYHVALEPWSGYPLTLDQAVVAGGARWLEPGEEVRAEVTLVAFDGTGVVVGVDRNGRIRRREAKM
jgi:galactose mutarotase-like enzyme